LENRGRRPRRGHSLSNSKPLDDPTVPFHVFSLQVIQEPPTLTDQLQQSSARVVILLVHLEVIREVSDPLTQEGNLNLG